NPGLNVTVLGRRLLPEIYRLHYPEGITGQWLVGFSAVAERPALPDSGFVAGSATRGKNWPTAVAYPHNSRIT
ncbi:MAG: hypothetical protein WB696_18565, partial [Chthoniobacterales bacterium]